MNRSVRIRGDRVSQRRHDLKLSQEDLAEMIKVSQIQISKYERGLNDPSADTLAALAESLNTTTDWLLGLTHNEKQQFLSAHDLENGELEIIQILRNKDSDTKKRIIDAIKVLAG